MAGTPVVASDDEQVGAVARVVGDEERDIFSGLVVGQGLLEPDLFVPADLVGELTPQHIRLQIPSSAVTELDAYEG